MAPVLPTIDIGQRTPVDMGNVFKPVGISEEQYRSGPVNFYGQAIDRSIADDTPDESQDSDQGADNTVTADIYSDRGDNDVAGRGQIISGTNAGKSVLQGAFADTQMYGVTDINLNSSAFKSTDLTKSAFSNFFDAATGQLSQIGEATVKAGLGTPMADSVIKGRPSAVGLPGAMAPMMSAAPMIGGLMAISTAAARAMQARDAAHFQAANGKAGAMMDLNGMLVTRAPGSFQYTGNMQGYTTEQVKSIEAVKRGFIPGTYKETQVDGKWTNSGTNFLFGMNSNDVIGAGGTYDPATGGYIGLDGSRAAGGTKQTAIGLVSAVNKTVPGSTLGWRSVAVARSQVKTDIFGNVKPGSKTFKEVLEGMARDSARQPNAEAKAQAAVDAVADYGGNDSGDSGSYGAADDEAGDVGTSMGGAGASDNPDDGGDYDDSFVEGGRVGYAPGGEAGFAQRPEFVGGNQTQPDGVSVADDQPRDVQEGTFVINAAAADFAGRDDIEKMLRDAYKKAGDTGQSGVSQEVAINVSKGEVMIPPHIAKVIGYDKLNKINNRGKKEIARRQEAAGGGFIDRKKFAAGDRVTLYRGEPLDPSKVVATDYGYGKEDVGKFHTPDVKKAGRFAVGAGKGNQVIKSRKVTIDELFDGVEEAWKTQAKKKTEYFAKLPKSELNKNLRFVRELKRAYLAGERSLDSMAMFLQEQVFHDDKSRINFIETFKNDPKSAGKLAGRALTKVATKATPPLAILGVAAEVFTPSDLGKSTLYDDSFMDYQFTPKE